MSKAENQGPKVLCVFVADCKATKGFGTTVAVVQGGSGKCRLYGKDSLANAYPESADICRTLTTARKMADNFGVKVITGKTACERFLIDNKLKWEGSENVIADKGTSGSKRGGFKTINYRAFQGLTQAQDRWGKRTHRFAFGGLVVSQVVDVGDMIDSTMRKLVHVTAHVEDGQLYLHRALVDNPYGVDCPITLVTREGLLRLACGPFEAGFVEDHLQLTDSLWVGRKDGSVKAILVHDDGCVESFDVCKVHDSTRTTEEIEVFQGRDYDGFDDFILSKDKTPIGTMRVYYP